METRFTKILGIKHPIMLAGMNWITEPKLVAAVSNAGGLGILATRHMGPEDARKQIKQVRELTDKPFGINQSLHGPRVKDNIDVAIEEKVPVINYSLGRPWFIDQVHAYGGKVIGTVAVVRHAVKAQELGADMISVTGHEAAAHGGDATSLVLIPMVASSVKIPIIAAGGFYDGRGLAAALLLGADAISMGTRFIVTQECNVHENFKNLIMKASEQDTLYSTRFDGMPGRALKTKGAEDMYNQKGVPLVGGITGALHVKKMLGLSWGDMLSSAMKHETTDYGSAGSFGPFQQLRFAGGTAGQERAIYKGDEKLGFMWARQCIGAIRDMPTVAELLDRIVSDAEKVISAAPGRFITTKPAKK